MAVPLIYGVIGPLADRVKAWMMKALSDWVTDNDNI